jgi:NAD(P)-dependent dehydrogenase (short-subunit alcohol dehydrogenase family)
MSTAIVTGGSRGIGLAIARAILKDGGRVMIAGLDRQRVDEAVTALSKESGDAARVAGAVADVRDRAAVDRLIADAVERFGAFDVLVNNAGVGVFADVSKMTDAEWQHVFETNLTGAFYCTRAAIPWLKRAGGGWIISISSLSSRSPFAGGAAYCASKAGLIAFSEALMQEVRADNIRVSVILPGSVATGFSHPTQATDDSWKLQPDDVAQAVADMLRFPARSLPSRVEIRPVRTKSAG